jgi:PHD/YefM family antitoxin component YafN of YafNO toxin-antitoxin module
MKVINYSEARQNFAAIFNTALKEDVIIKRKDGNKFRLATIREPKKGQSPLETIKGIKTKVTMVDILDAIREGRERK